MNTDNLKNEKYCEDVESEIPIDSMKNVRHRLVEYIWMVKGSKKG